jgi:AGZA family xanthine/uracil permease-like MFS transporter
MNFYLFRVALAMIWGNFYYVYMARKLAYKEKRDDICAMPYGINTPGACNRILFICLTHIFKYY